MVWKEYKPKIRFRRVITNTFLSNEDCEMFIMVLKQQWPKHINKLPNSELEITRSVESANIMSAIWTLSDIKHFEILEKIGNEIIYPYRNKLSPKSISIKTETLCLLNSNCVTILGVSTRMKAPKGIVFFGATASNGKSTILSLIRLILPQSATCSIPPSDFEREQSLATLVGKTANLTDEISNHKFIASDKMKSLITGDIVAAKVIYQPVFNFKPIATHIFATNELPNFKGGVDAGVERRMLVIPFNKTIPEKKRITNLEELIADKEASLLVSAAISIGGRAYQRGTFNIPASCKDATQQWFKDSDPVREWYAEGEMGRHVGRKPKLLKELYKNFCEDIREFEDANYLPGKRRFIAQIKALVETNIDWRIERHGSGLIICRNTLV